MHELRKATGEHTEKAKRKKEISPEFELVLIPTAYTSVRT